MKNFLFIFVICFSLTIISPAHAFNLDDALNLLEGSSKKDDKDETEKVDPLKKIEEKFKSKADEEVSKIYEKIDKVVDKYEAKITQYEVDIKKVINDVEAGVKDVTNFKSKIEGYAKFAKIISTIVSIIISCSFLLTFFFILKMWRRIQSFAFVVENFVSKIEALEAQIKELKGVKKKPKKS